jgi:hypothetical protein
MRRERVKRAALEDLPAFCAANAAGRRSPPITVRRDQLMRRSP